jgi:hypothetical protein
VEAAEDLAEQRAREQPAAVGLRGEHVEDAGAAIAPSASSPPTQIDERRQRDVPQREHLLIIIDA